MLNVKVVKVLHYRTSSNRNAAAWCYTDYVYFKLAPLGDVITLVHITKVSSRWSRVQIKLGVLSRKTKVWQKNQRFMPWCSILTKDKSFPALYLPFHQYRRKQCEAKPHFLLYAGYLHSAMWRVSSVMNSPEVIRKMLLLSGKNKPMKKWWWINRKWRQIRKRWSRNGTSWLRNRWVLLVLCAV